MRDAARMEDDGREARYDLVAAWQWRLALERERAERSKDPESEMDAAKLRKLNAEAESKELDLEVKRGALVPIDDVEVLVRESLEAVDSVLRNSPSRLAPALAKAAQIPVKSARTVLRDMVESVRGAIREGMRSDAA